MSVREEDRQKNGCPSRGLGIAAAAIGVGVGAALYYFFSKRQENPHMEGSTSEWSCERAQPFNDSSDSYTTLSEYETSDTSIYDNSSFVVSPDETSEDSDSSSESSGSNSTRLLEFEPYSDSSRNQASDFSGSEYTEWDVTSSSLGVPEDRSSPRSPLSSFITAFHAFISPRRNPRPVVGIVGKKTEDEQMTVLRQQAFRERSWTLEECSICFDVMLRNQEVTSLPCAHNFHTECIMPWLQEKQTCPNCRKVAE